jgi:biotin-[acetyl-CoA-carboxylase] ligase BirA-like protein
VRQARELRGQLVAQLRKGRLVRRVCVARDALVLEERLAAAHPLAVGDVEARVDDEPVEPGRELGVAAKLAQPHAELRERFLGGVAGVLGIREQVRGEPLDAWGVPLAERRERLRVAVVGPLDEDGITELLVDERSFRPRVLPNLTASAKRRLHGRLVYLAVSDSLAPEAVLPRLRGRFGQPYEHVGSTPSTQLLLPADAPEGALVAAEEQTAGRGRLGRRWLAPVGTSLLCSLQLRPGVSAERLPELTVIAARACAEAIAAVTGLEPAVEFPNDVLLDGRKLAGILAEAREERIVLGMGVNVNVPAAALPEGVDRPATSLLAETGRKIDRAELLVELLERLERRYDAWLSGAP